MEEKKKSIKPERRARLLLLLATALVIVSLLFGQASKMQTLAATAPYWIETEDGLRFDFGSYLDELDGEFDFETRGSLVKGFHYSALYFGVGERFGNIRTCYKAGKLIGTYLTIYQGDGEIYYEARAEGDDFTNTKTQIVSLEGENVLTKELFDDFIRQVGTYAQIN